MHKADVCTSFNENLKKIMKEKSMTQKDLANKTNITEASISKYVNGQRTPRIDIVVNIANALDISVDFLLNSQVSHEVIHYSKIHEILTSGKLDISDEEKKKLIALLLKDL